MRTAAAIFAFSAAIAIAAPAAAQTHPITTQNPGAAIVVTSADPVIATYLGTSAAFDDLLYLVRPGDTDLFLFDNQTSIIGSTVNLGSFAPGTELIFRLLTPATDDDGNPFSYFSGAASRNPDGAPHAAVQSNYLVPGTTLVSFEDLNQNDFPDSLDFNDLSFSFTGTIASGAVPEPASWALMILGFGAAGGAMRTRARRVVFG